MNARTSLPILALAAASVLLGCASGDGVPKAQVRNDGSMCMVEAAWFDDGENQPQGKGYYFINPINPTGQTEAREVVEGSGYAYAVFKSGGGDCYEMAQSAGGELWRTKDKISMSPGKTTMIVFSDATAEKVCNDTKLCGDPTEAAKESWRFPRIAAK